MIALVGKINPEGTVTAFRVRNEGGGHQLGQVLYDNFRTYKDILSRHLYFERSGECGLVDFTGQRDFADIEPLRYHSVWGLEAALECPRVNKAGVEWLYLFDPKRDEWQIRHLVGEPNSLVGLGEYLSRKC